MAPVCDDLCSLPPGVMELCTRGLGGSVSQLKTRGVSLSCVRTLVVVAEDEGHVHQCEDLVHLLEDREEQQRCLAAQGRWPVRRYWRTS